MFAVLFQQMRLEANDSLHLKNKDCSLAGSLLENSRCHQPVLGKYNCVQNSFVHEFNGGRINTQARSDSSILHRLAQFPANVYTSIVQVPSSVHLNPCNLTHQKFF